MDEVTLSILVVSHNQYSMLPRCLNSILEQDIKYTFEIVISDDNSSDGTWDLICDFQKQHPSIIVATRCNSDDCNPVTISERCGWNKLNAYLHSRGKYLVNIDADDYIRGKDIYQQQISLLEKHPMCSLCMQRTLSIQEGTDIANGVAWPSSPLLVDGNILSFKDILQNRLRGLNQSYMMRRHSDDDMMALYGKWFDDTIITMHYLQYGDVVFLDRADYVWVRYDTSISHSIPKLDADIVYSLLPVHHSLLIPSLRNGFIQYGKSELCHLLKISSKVNPSELRVDYSDYINEFDGFIFRWIVSDKHSIWGKCRFNICRTILRTYNILSPASKIANSLFIFIIWHLLVK